jgi:hypothetical protein
VQESHFTATALEVESGPDWDFAQYMFEDVVKDSGIDSDNNTLSPLIKGTY